MTSTLSAPLHQPDSATTAAPTTPASETPATETPAQSAPSQSATARARAFIADVLDSGLTNSYPEVWIHLADRSDLMDQAARIDELAQLGNHLPLRGLVCAVKDNIDVAGMPTTAAHPRATYVPTVSASVVQRLQDAGALVAGKTNMDQFATGLTGARSPFGVVRSAVDPLRISGGSSSGSGAAVGLAMVDFALATDTAGSGRVPANFNGVVGIKPTLGLVAKDGVVPACSSFDCVTVMASTLPLATDVLNIMVGGSATDPSSRVWPATAPLAAPPQAKIALPDEASLSSLSPTFQRLFAQAASRLEQCGHRIEVVDFAPFLKVAKMLYESALVAQRTHSFHRFTKDRPLGTIDVVADVADRGSQFSAVDYLDAEAALDTQRAHLSALVSSFDALLIPTAPRHPSITETLENMAGVNAEMGMFTNFMNLLDLAGVAVPFAQGESVAADEGAFGVTVVASSFHDQVALDLASQLTNSTAHTLDIPATSVVVFGAHRTGQPLNYQLTTRGARLAGTVTTTPDYTMHALPAQPPVGTLGALPPRPAIAPHVSQTSQPKDSSGSNGAALRGEEWLLNPVALAQFLTDLRAPLALGPITLDDGRTELGFTVAGTRPEPDISEHGDWLTYLTTL